MNTSTTRPFAFAHRNAAPVSGFGTSLQEILICIFLIAALNALVWNIFSSLPAYGGQPTSALAVQMHLPPVQPNCFAHTREQVESEGAPQGCPTDPMAYHRATLRQINN